MREMSVVAQKYLAVWAVLADVMTVTDAARPGQGHLASIHEALTQPFGSPLL
jgi:hypothetical protein